MVPPPAYIKLKFFRWVVFVSGRVWLLLMLKFWVCRLKDGLATSRSKEVSIAILGEQ